MRLICPNCATQYEIDAEAIPEDGREVQCGVCDHLWFQDRAGLGSDEDTVGTLSVADPVATNDEPAAPSPPVPEAIPAETVPKDASAPEAAPEPELVPEPEPEPEPAPTPAPVIEAADEGGATEGHAAQAALADEQIGAMDEPDVGDLVESRPAPSTAADADAGEDPQTPEKQSFSFDQVRQQLKANPAKFGWVQVEDAPVEASVSPSETAPETSDIADETAARDETGDATDTAIVAALAAEPDAEPDAALAPPDMPDPATERADAVSAPDTHADAVDAAMAGPATQSEPDQTQDEPVEATPEPDVAPDDAPEPVVEFAADDDGAEALDGGEALDAADNAEHSERQDDHEIEESVRAALAAARAAPVSAGLAQMSERQDPNVATPSLPANDTGEDGQSFADRLKSRVEHAARARETDKSDGVGVSGVLQGASQAAVNAASSRLDQRAAEAPAASDAAGMPDAEALTSSLRRRPAQTVPNKRALRPDATPEPRKSRFGTGVFMAVLLCLILVAVYVLRPQISAAIPAISPYLDVYAANIDQARLWVQDLVGTLMAKVVPAGDAAE